MVRNFWQTSKPRDWRSCFGKYHNQRKNPGFWLCLSSCFISDQTIYPGSWKYVRPMECLPQGFWQSNTNALKTFNFGSKKVLKFFQAFSRRIWISIIILILLSGTLVAFMRSKIIKIQCLKNHLIENHLFIWGIYCQQGLSGKDEIAMNADDSVY